ncbi:MAG TPA: hypothetical protein EYG78_05375 [Sulfurovum sp.]|nr:hypothetical protein [Sulfurovum sp.]
MAPMRSFWLLWGVFLVLFTTLLSAQSEYKYSYVPKKVYENQVFPVTVICLSGCSKEVPKFTFDILSDVQPIYDEPLSIHNGDDSFYTFYFKASKTDVRIPKLFIKSAHSELTLEPQSVLLGSLKKRDDYCGVLAADMKIINSQVSNYDEENHLVTLTIGALEANLEDMIFNNVLESGIEHLRRDNAKVEAEFYFVLPASAKNIKFTYFNTIKKQYVYLQTPIELADTTVVTQTDLNPLEDSFELLKKYSFMFLVGFFFLMFLIKRDFFYLVFAVVSLITLLTFYIPHKKICVKQGAPLFILPTQTSTMSTKIPQKLETMLLAEHGDFKKVEYEKGLIGWIRSEDVCEN